AKEPKSRQLLEQNCSAEREEKQESADACLIAGALPAKDWREDRGDEPEQGEAASVFPLKVGWFLGKGGTDQKKQGPHAASQHVAGFNARGTRRVRRGFQSRQ